MLPDLFLPALRDELSQGDIVDVLPTGAVRSLQVFRAFQTEAEGDYRKGALLKHPFPKDHQRPPAPPLFKDQKRSNMEWVALTADLRRCIVISDDCVAIAKTGNKALTHQLSAKAQAAPWHVAPLFDWPSPRQIVPDRNIPLGDLISQGKVKRYVEVPELMVDGAVVLPHSYINLQFITPLSASMFAEVSRSASMSDYGRFYLAARVFQFFSGMELPAEVTCSKCGSIEQVFGGSPSSEIAAPRVEDPNVEDEMAAPTPAAVHPPPPSPPK